MRDVAQHLEVPCISLVEIVALFILFFLFASNYIVHITNFFSHRVACKLLKSGLLSVVL